MGELTVTGTGINAGVWEGLIKVTPGDGNSPDLVVLHQGQPLEHVEITEDSHAKDCFLLRAPIPAHLLSDGVQTFLVADPATGETLDSFAIVAGEPLQGDITAELELLRAELELLKRVVRNHISETG